MGTAEGSKKEESWKRCSALLEGSDNTPTKRVAPLPGVPDVLPKVAPAHHGAKRHAHNCAPSLGREEIQEY